MLMIATHFLRYANMTAVIISLLIPLLLFVRKKFIVRVIQITLVVVAFLWIDTVMNLIAMREQIGYAWTRMAIILGGVVLFTIASGSVFYTKTLRERYGIFKGF
jgi:hypothetical protein